MICLRLSRVLKKKSFLDVFPDHSVQRSVSIDNEIREPETLKESESGTRGMETLTVAALDPVINDPTRMAAHANKIERNVRVGMFFWCQLHEMKQ